MFIARSDASRRGGSLSLSTPDCCRHDLYLKVGRPYMYIVYIY